MQVFFFTNNGDGPCRSIIRAAYGPDTDRCDVWQPVHLPTSENHDITTGRRLARTRHRLGCPAPIEPLRVDQITRKTGYIKTVQLVRDFLTGMLSMWPQRILPSICGDSRSNFAQFVSNCRVKHRKSYQSAE